MRAACARVSVEINSGEHLHVHKSSEAVAPKEKNKPQRITVTLLPMLSGARREKRKVDPGDGRYYLRDCNRNLSVSWSKDIPTKHW